MGQGLNEDVDILAGNQLARVDDQRHVIVDPQRSPNLSPAGGIELKAITVRSEGENENSFWRKPQGFRHYGACSDADSREHIYSASEQRSREPAE